MLAARIHAKEDLRIETFAAPAPGAGEVLLRLGAGGICGSDLHYYFEGRNGSFVVREPLIPGHEASAVVAAIGDGVTRVTPAPTASTTAEASWPGISGSRTTKLPLRPSK